MSEISSAYSSTSRITGIFSSLDTDAIVKDLVQVQQTKVDVQKQKQTKSEWESDALDTVYDLVKDFKSTYLSQTGADSMLTASAYYKFAVTSSSDSKAVEVTAGTSANTGSVTVNSVTQLAKNASVSSSAKVSADGSGISEKNTATLGSLTFANGLQFNSSGKISFQINGSTFSFSKDTTLQNMINAVNADEKAGVTMKYSRLTDTFTITADSGGSSSALKITNISGNAFGTNGAFGIGEGAVGTDGFGTVGQDAVATIDGVQVTQNSNSFTVDGLTYTLKSTTDTANTFTVDRDTSSTVSTIKKFIDAYNTLVEKVDVLYSEKDLSSDYPPLTDDQRADMSDDEIEKWESKAKSGILRHDSALSSFLTSIKTTFFSNVGGSGTNVTSIGITSGSYFSDDKGKIVIDEDKLTEALKAQPEKVISMFTDSSSDSSQRGLVYKMMDISQTCLTNIKDEKETADDQTDDLDDKISTMEDKLDEMAERYYNKFAAMETALSKLNSQQNMLSSLLGS